MFIEEALHENVHVEHVEEAAAEARAKGNTRLFAHTHARIVQRKFVHCISQLFKAILAKWIYPCRSGSGLSCSSHVA